jgi:hypothetical protein
VALSWPRPSGPRDGSLPLDDPLDSPPATDAGSPEGSQSPPLHPRAGGEERTSDSDPAPGLADQVRATRDSAKRLFDAHAELARAEFSDIGDAVKRAVAYVGVAIAAILFAALLVTIGLPLFLGEWLFGSIGWGILLGLLLLVAFAVAFGVLALGPAVKGTVGRSFLVAAVLAIVVGVILGLNLSNRAWASLADSMASNLDAGSRPLIVAVLAVGIVGAVIGLVGGLRAGGAAAAIGGLVGGAIVGAFVGALTAVAPGRRVGAALGISVGLVAWVALIGASVARGGFDTDALKERFWPARTIEVTKETIEWARKRVPGSPTLTRRS